MYQNWSWGVLGSDRNRHRPGQRCLRDCPSLIWSDPFPKNLVMNYMVNLYSYRFTWRSSSDQIRSVAESCPTLCDPMNPSTPGLPVHHQLPKLTETHVHRVSDAIQPSHPLVPFFFCPQSLPASGSFPMSQLFAWGVQSIGVSASTSVLPMNTQDWSPLGWTGWVNSNISISMMVC